MPIEHPLPTSATAKLLYANAFSCAYPDCNDPLYREDETTGRWVLNSHICHINARSEGGPRWAPEQSPDDNRAAENLVLMCFKHASAIDDPKNLDSYPTTTLREWKRLQFEEYRRRMSGWPLTDAMAKDAVAISFLGGDINISNSTVQLGGESGNAPGAGGGGGGAIGHGAHAGRGGDGGSIQIPDDQLAEFTSRIARERLDYTPGAGGGGGGATGDHSVAGDGGSGGEIASGCLTIEDGDICQVEIGEGGKTGALPGQYAEKGGDTVFRIRAPDGTVKHEIRAAGGAPARSDRLPYGVAEISETDLAGGFRIPVLMIANSVDVRDGLLFVLAGGWETFTVPQLPFEAVWVAIVKATWKEIDPSVTRGLQLCILDPQGTEVSGIPMLIPPEHVRNGTNFMWVGPIGAALNSSGMWTVRVRSGERVLSQIGVRVGSN